MLLSTHNSIMSCFFFKWPISLLVWSVPTIPHDGGGQTSKNPNSMVRVGYTNPDTKKSQFSKRERIMITIFVVGLMYLNSCFLCHIAIIILAFIFYLFLPFDCSVCVCVSVCCNDRHGYWLPICDKYFVLSSRVNPVTFHLLATNDALERRKMRNMCCFCCCLLLSITLAATFCLFPYHMIVVWWLLIFVTNMISAKGMYHFCQRWFVRCWLVFLCVCVCVCWVQVACLPACPSDFFFFFRGDDGEWQNEPNNF